MGSWEGRVAVVTGGARGMGRAHAVRLAREGADVALLDRCADSAAAPYPLATPEDLGATVALVEAEGRRALGITCDVRDAGAVEAAVSRVTDEFGRVDILLANAGITGGAPVQQLAPEVWAELIDTNLTGVFHSIRAVAPGMVSRRFGRIVATASMLGRSSAPTQAAYVASKWGVIGLVKAAAQDLAAYGVTVNAVAPGNIDTPMVHNDALFRMVRPDLENPSADDAAVVLKMLHLQPVPWLAPEEVTDAVMFLLAAEHVTGSVVDVNAGASARFTA